MCLLMWGVRLRARKLSDDPSEHHETGGAVGVGDDAGVVGDRRHQVDEEGYHWWVG